MPHKAVLQKMVGKIRSGLLNAKRIKLGCMMKKLNQQMCSVQAIVGAQMLNEYTNLNILDSDASGLGW